MKYRGLTSNTRKRLATLLAPGRGIITIEDVMKELAVDRAKARQILFSFHRNGWLKLVTGGVYVPIPLESLDSTLVEENPLIVASYLFNKCYIGAWSAAFHWKLTNQVFSSHWVFTEQLVRKREVKKGQHSFVLFHVKPKEFIGTTYELFGIDKVLFSDPHRTVLDFLHYPEAFDAKSMLNVLKEYLCSEHKDLLRLMEYASVLGNKNLFKRIGFLLEKLSPEDQDIIEYCQKNINNGPAFLTSLSENYVHVKKWRLKVPLFISKRLPLKRRRSVK